VARGQSDAADASSGSLAGILRRRELLFWLACILFANQLFSPPIDPSIAAPSDAQGGLTLFRAVFSRSIFYYLGWYAVLSLLIASDARHPATARDIAVTVSAALLNFIPASSSNWLATTAVALFLVVRGHRDANLSAASAVLLALSFNGFWGPKLFDVFAYYIVHVDAALVGAALAATQPAMEWTGTIIGQPGGHSLLIFGPCSSFHNISLGLLCWISITKLVRTSWARADLAVAVGVCAIVVLLNASRLYLMALGHDYYVFWHGGPGEQFVAWVMTVLVLLISLWGAVRLGTR
jgi:hypothetical protein